MSVPRPERIVHQLEEEDPSIWVVFAKTFDSERVLVRFPADPVYRRLDNGFEAISTHYGYGELSLIVQNIKGSVAAKSSQEIVYRDAETGRWIFEKHIETAQHQYVLRLSHPFQSRTLFQQFVNSFQIE